MNSDGNSDGNSDSDDESSTNSSSRRMTMGPSPPPPSSSQPPDVTGVTGDVTADFFKGTIPFIVYSNACRTVQDNTIAFNVQFLGACEDDFPWLSKTILNFNNSGFPFAKEMMSPCTLHVDCFLLYTNKAHALWCKS